MSSSTRASTPVLSATLESAALPSSARKIAGPAPISQSCGPEKQGGKLALTELWKFIHKANTKPNTSDLQQIHRNDCSRFFMPLPLGAGGIMFPVVKFWNLFNIVSGSLFSRQILFFKDVGSQDPNSKIPSTNPVFNCKGTVSKVPR